MEARLFLGDGLRFRWQARQAERNGAGPAAEPARPAAEPTGPAAEPARPAAERNKTGPTSRAGAFAWQGFGYWLLADVGYGHCLLAIGYWLLYIGWILAVGYFGYFGYWQLCFT